MGCSTSKPVTPEDIEKKKNHDAIEVALLEEKAKQPKQVKMLLLGAGEAGKSTILKQMQLIHGAGFTTDRNLYRDIILNNILQVTQSALNAMTTRLNIPLERPENQEHADIIMKDTQFIVCESLPDNMKQAIQQLLLDKGFQEALEKAKEYQIHDSFR
jgi:guanine nucleotide-binding protein subunit alpha